jgi:hypothetical protein
MGNSYVKFWLGDDARASVGKGFPLLRNPLAAYMNPFGKQEADS